MDSFPVSLNGVVRSARDAAYPIAYDRDETGGALGCLVTSFEDDYETVRERWPWSFGQRNRVVKWSLAG